MESLRRKDTLKLIEAFDGSTSCSLKDISGHPIEGIAHWDLRHYFGKDTIRQWKPWLRQVGFAGVYPSYFDDMPKLVNVTKDEGNYGYCCLQTFDWLTVPAEKLSVWEVDVNKFLQAIANLFAIPDHTRRYQRPELPDTLWKVGAIPTSDGAYTGVYLARGLSRHLKRIVEHFNDTGKTGVLLTTSRFVPELIRWPNGLIVKRIEDILDENMEDTVVDQCWLDAMNAKGTADSASDKCFPVYFDERRNILSIDGKPDWKISGVKHRAVVHYMYRQFKLGRCELKAKELLDSTQSPGQVGGSKQISSIFSACDKWREYIGSPRRGYYAFNL